MIYLLLSSDCMSAKEGMMNTNVAINDKKVHDAVNFQTSEKLLLSSYY